MKRLLLILALTTLACSLSSVVGGRSARTTALTTPKAVVRESENVSVAAVVALNVRQHPHELATVLFNVFNGDIVTVVGECTVNGWVKIEYQGRRGWVNADYLSGSVCE